MDDAIGTARLSAGEIDDQAVAEIAALFGETVNAARLISLAAIGPLVVARRPCGQSPEIVGVAWMTAGGEAGPRRFVCKVRPGPASGDLETRLRAALEAQLQRRSLFRGRDRAPLGLSPAFHLQAAG